MRRKSQEETGQQPGEAALRTFVFDLTASLLATRSTCLNLIYFLGLDPCS